MFPRLWDLGQDAGDELEGVDALGPRAVAVMALWLREVEDLIAIWLEHQSDQAHGRTDHVADQRLERLGVACEQTHLIVDGEAECLQDKSNSSRRKLKTL